MIFLGVDSGTQSTKTIALDAESGAVLASAQQSYDFIPGLPQGHLEQNPSDWVDAMLKTIAACLEQLGKRKSEVRGIGVSGQQHGFVPLDERHQVIRPAKLWCDTSTVDQCAKLEAEFGGAKGLIELAGNAIPPGFTAPKILWLKENEPANFSALRHVQLPHDFLNHHLTGELRMEYGDASGTGLLDVRTRTWCKELVEFIDPALRDCLPEVMPSSEPCGLLRNVLKERWALAQDVIVSAGGGDNMMGAIGTGNISAGTVTASFGTSGTLYAYSDKPVIDAQGEVAAFCDSTDGWLPLVCTMNVTVATEKVRSLFSWDIAALESAVAGATPGAEGILFLPYLTGERTPNLPAGSGVFHGLTMANMNPQNMARAVMEGATLGLGYGLQRFRQLGLDPTEIRLTGGGSNSPAWRQIAADVFNVPVVALAIGEGAALGAALQAAWCWNRAESEVSSLKALVERTVRTDEKTRCEPSVKTRGMYDALQARQTSLTRHLHTGGHL